MYVGPASTAAASEPFLYTGVESPLSPLSCGERLSSMTASTLRSLDSDLRWEWESVGVKGTEWRLLTVGGDAEGERTVAELVGDIAGDVLTSTHAAVLSGKNPPGFVQEFLPSLLLSSSGVDEVKGLGLADGVLAITESGGRMLKILSSSGGGP